MGDGGCEGAGENTSNPDNFKLFSSEVKYSGGDASGLLAGSGVTDKETVPLLWLLLRGVTT